ncbi:MAG: flagellar basal body rod C-terminal domain-containing protein, partial [Clostridium sp.]
SGESAYTRDGSFTVDAKGNIVDTNGNKLHLEYFNGFTDDTANFTKDNFLVDSNGSVYIKNDEKFEKVAEIPVYTAVGDRAFASVGQNLFQPVAGNDVFRTRDADFFQGFSEGSNVDIAEEFADMIVTQRSFELSSRGVKTADEMWGMVNNLRSR